MKKVKVNFERFTIGFMNGESSVDDTDASEESENQSPDEVLEQMESDIPRSAQFMGRIEDEVCNFTSWKIDDHYFIIPWEGIEFSWAIFRISWDDNWGRYEWQGCARVSDVEDREEAARRMFKALFRRWRVTSEPVYREFLKRLEKAAE